MFMIDPLVDILGFTIIEHFSNEFKNEFIADCKLILMA